MHKCSKITSRSLLITAVIILAALLHTPLSNRTTPHNCRFWGIVYTNKDQPVLNAIHSHLDSLCSLGSFHADGWGIAYYLAMENGQYLPVVERGEPQAPLDPRYKRAVDHAADHACQGTVAHIRSGSSGPSSGIPDPHPFSRYSAYRTYHIFFAHNGTLNTDILFDLITSINPHYLSVNPPDYAPTYLDSDLYALLIIEIIDMNSNRSIEECIQMAVTKIDSAIALGSVQCNCVMFDGLSLYAVNYSRTPIDALTLYFYSPFGRTDFWAVASEPLDDQPHAWIAVPNSTLVVLTPDNPPRFLDVLIDQDRNNPNQHINIFYPNPLKAPVSISLTLPEYCSTNHFGQLNIINSAGQVIRTFEVHANANRMASIIWDGRDHNGISVPTGLYFGHLLADNTFVTKKMIYLR